MEEKKKDHQLSSKMPQMNTIVFNYLAHHRVEQNCFISILTSTKVEAALLQMHLTCESYFVWVIIFF